MEPKILASSGLAVVVVACLVSIIAADEEHSEYLPRHHVERRDISSKISNRELTIVTIRGEPYTMVSPDGVGNDRYTGFIPELVLKLSQRLGFTYKFREEYRYGYYDNATQQWTGMIGEVIKKEKDPSQGADLAAAAITITSAREKVVNFVKPFQNLGFGILIKRPDYASDLPFTFNIFQPFEPAVWCLIMLIVVVVGLFLWLMNMFNPYEWAGRYDLGLADKEQSEYFSLIGSLWFAFTSLQWQGFEKSPRSAASKLLGCVWFAFVSIVLVTYTAGIVNHLFWASMVHRSGASSRAPFLDLAHLITNKDYKYGCVENGQTFAWLMNVARGEEFEAVRRYLRTPEGQAGLVKNMSAGFDKARKEKYALIGESLTIKHALNQRPCDLTTVGDLFGARSYGLAVPLNSTILGDLNVALLEMIEGGEIDELERKWFVDRNECWNVTMVDRVKTDAASTLYVNGPKSVDLNTFWSALVLVTVGIAVSLVVALAEIVYYRRWGKYDSNNQPQGHHLSVNEGTI